MEVEPLLIIEGGCPCLYQWDVDQRLEVMSDEIIEVHFVNAVTSPALVCEVYEEDGRRFANVPNILLQQSWPVQAYGCCDCRVREVEVIKVVRREKPADYVYTETEVKTFSDLEARIKALESASSEETDESTYEYTEIGVVKYDTGEVAQTRISRNTGFISLEGVQRVVGNEYNDSNGAGVAFYDSDKNYLQDISIKGVGYRRTHDIDLTEAKYSEASYVVFSGYGPTDFSGYSCTVYRYDIWQVVAQTNPLNGKIVSFNGDSICAVAGGYGKIIAGRNKMTYENIAVSEATIAAETYKSDGTTPQHWVCRSIVDMREDADYAIVEGGINDAANYKVPLGTITEYGTWEFDDTTFFGAFESMLQQLITRFAGKKVGYVAAHMMRGTISDDGNAANSYYEAAKKCCEKWRVPICDLNLTVPPFHKFGSGAPESLQNLRATYTINGDGWHLNDAGYKKYYCDKIEAWMKTL